MYFGCFPFVLLLIEQVCQNKTGKNLMYLRKDLLSHVPIMSSCHDFEIVIVLHIAADDQLF